VDKESKSLYKEMRTMPRFDLTIAGEINLDLILYGVPEELPRERELLADGMMLTWVDPPRLWRTISPHRAAAWVFSRALGTTNSGRLRCSRCGKVAWMFRACGKQPAR